MSGRLRPTVVDTRLSEERVDEIAERALCAPVFIDIVVPRTKIAGKMRLVTRDERFQANADARRFMERAGFPVDASAGAALGAIEQWNFEIAARLLAAAVREPDRPDHALASIEEWRECDDDQISALFLRYQDLEREHDPLTAGELSDAELSAILAAAKKKDVELLISYGSSKLARFMTTSVGQPASSTISES